MKLFFNVIVEGDNNTLSEIILNWTDDSFKCQTIHIAGSRMEVADYLRIDGKLELMRTWLNCKNNILYHDFSFSEIEYHEDLIEEINIVKKNNNFYIADYREAAYCKKEIPHINSMDLHSALEVAAQWDSVRKADMTYEHEDE